MVRIEESKKDLNHIDFSFIPSLKCNLFCSFCMYNSSPSNKRTLPRRIYKPFIEKIEWSLIRNIGLYGGEPFISLDLYQEILDLLPRKISKFIVTNGTWSRKQKDTEKFLSFCKKNNLKIFVSSMKEQILFQNRALLESLKEKKILHLKKEDKLIPMGRAKNKINKKCTFKCLWHKQPIRLALLPTGDILFQNCDGEYPIVGNYKVPFKELYSRAKSFRYNTCKIGIGLNEKKYCAVQVRGLNCPGYCCYYCPEKTKCLHPCSRRYPMKCKELITKKEFTWRKIFDSMTKGVLTA